MSRKPNPLEQIAAGSCGCGCLLIFAGAFILAALVLLAAAGSAG